MLRLQILPYATEADVSLTELSSFIGRQWWTEHKKIFIINNPLDMVLSIAMVILVILVLKESEKSNRTHLYTAYCT